MRFAGDEVHLVDGAGKTIHVAQHVPSPAISAVSPEASGRVAYAYWSNPNSGTPINYFNSTWTVPPAPTTNEQQTIFLFNSLVPAGSGEIIQPVLQWGPSAAGGGPYWTVASWYIIGSQVYHTSLVKVSVGQVLNGLITLTGGSYNYVSQFEQISGTSLSATSPNQLVWASETLEVYNVGKASDFPAGATKFSNINLRTTSGTPAVTWSTVSDPADGLTTTVNIGGATNAAITIKYPS